MDAAQKERCRIWSTKTTVHQGGRRKKVVGNTTANEEESFESRKKSGAEAMLKERKGKGKFGSIETFFV